MCDNCAVPRLCSGVLPLGASISSHDYKSISDFIPNGAFALGYVNLGLERGHSC